MEDKNIEYLEKLYATDKNVAIISRDVEGLKEDIKDIKKSLQKLLDEPENDLKFWKNKVASLFISAIALLVALGFGVYAKQQINTANEIISEYKEVDK